MRETKIIEEIERKNETAICEVMDKYSRLLWLTASAVLCTAGSAEDVEECVADAFIYLWEHPEKFDAARGSLKSWLTVIVRTKAIDRYRALVRKQEIPLKETLLSREAGLAERVIEREGRAMLVAAVCGLEETDREILLRRYCYEQKPKEIALAMDMSVKQVDNHLYQTKRKLREVLSD